MLLSGFTDDPATVQAGAVYLRWQAAAFVFMALEVVYSGAFTGAGNTVPTFWIESLFTGLRIPLAIALASWAGYGVAGVWMAIAASTFVKGVLFGLWWRRRSSRLSASAASGPEGPAAPPLP
jgi:Na+-driven multidrug efflux pump